MELSLIKLEIYKWEHEKHEEDELLVIEHIMGLIDRYENIKREIKKHDKLMELSIIEIEIYKCDMRNIKDVNSLLLNI